MTKPNNLPTPAYYMIRTKDGYAKGFPMVNKGWLVGVDDYKWLISYDEVLEWFPLEED